MFEQSIFYLTHTIVGISRVIAFEYRLVLYERYCQNQIFGRVDRYKWEFSFSFQEPAPNWSIIMHILHTGQAHPGSSSIVFLSMINMNSGHMTCIYSTLNHVYGLATRSHVSTVITFDHPLFWKAWEIMIGLPDTSGSSTEGHNLEVGQLSHHHESVRCNRNLD